MTITYEIFAWICGVIITAGAAGGVIYKILSPFLKSHKDNMTYRGKIEDTILKLSNGVSLNEKRLDNFDQIYKVQCKAFLVMLNHMIDGNGIEGMKKIRDELQATIIDM